MDFLTPMDAIFLAGESREHPMHVGGMQLFEPPDGAGPDFVRSLHGAMESVTEVTPRFRRHPRRTFGNFSNLTWAHAEDIDFEYHVRRSALPSPGRVRELLELVGRLHGTLLDRHRPLWEAHVIEGLADGRFAVYVKVHHALMDGVSAQRLLQRTLTEDPHDTTVRVPWNLPGSGRPASEPTGVSDLFRTGLHELIRAARSSVPLARAVLGDRLTLPMSAPTTMFNVPIGGARRFAAQSWPMDRLAAVRKAAEVTLNDVVLAMCSAALRAYLIEQDALPDTSLVAMVPVSLRGADESDAGGNLVGAMLCTLATDRADPADRLQAISASMHEGKQIYAQLPRAEVLALSALLTGPVLLPRIPGLESLPRAAFNLVISNVPGPRRPMYLGGARLAGNYPLSIPIDGQAVNITVTTNAGNLDVGIVGCRSAVPHLQRLLTHLDTGLSELEHATLPG